MGGWEPPMCGVKFPHKLELCGYAVTPLCVWYCINKYTRFFVRYWIWYLFFFHGIICTKLYEIVCIWKLWAYKTCFTCWNGRSDKEGWRLLTLDQWCERILWNCFAVRMQLILSSFITGLCCHWLLSSLIRWLKLDTDKVTWIKSWNRLAPEDLRSGCWIFL